MEINQIKVSKKDIRDAYQALKGHSGFEILRKRYWLCVDQETVDEYVANGDDPVELINLVIDGFPGTFAAIER